VEGSTEAVLFPAASTVMEKSLGADVYTHFDLMGVSVFDAGAAFGRVSVNTQTSAAPRTTSIKGDRSTWADRFTGPTIPWCGRENSKTISTLLE
jgi:hypothetical protein